MMSNSMMHNLHRSLFLLLMLVFLPLMAEAKIYLVSVGISDYPAKNHDLRLPHNDAATIQWLYNENKNAETSLLRNQNATISNVKAAMRKMFSKANTNDIIVLFFSGHGVKGGFVCYDGFLKYSDIRSEMSASTCKNKMIFADACFSGAIRDSGNKNTADYGSLGNNIMLFLSCRSNEVSIETPKMTNGFFTFALQHGLRGGADTNNDRIITAKELFNYVSTKVKALSKNRQHPVMWGKFSDDMAVMTW